MRYFNLTIFTFIILFAFSACNEEEGLTPVAQNSYIKIIKGKGSDAPLCIEELNGDLLIVSNSTIREGTVTSNQLRILKVNLNGTELTALEDQYFPKNIDQDWIAEEVLVIDNSRIIIGGTARGDSTMFFLELNAQLDSVNAQYYSSDATTYNLTGLSYEEATSKISFSGSERANSQNYTLFGQLNASDLSIDQIYRTEKARALPVTSILPDANGGLIWAYNAGNSVLARSNTKDMRQLQETDVLEFKNVENSSIRTKELFMSINGESILFGELSRNGQETTELFFYNATTKGAPIIFGETGQNQLNGVKQTENGYLIAGSTEISELGSTAQKDFLLSYVGLNGGQRFADPYQSFGSDADEELHDAVMVNDHIYSIGSTVIGIENTLLLIKTDKFGDLVN